MRSRQKPSPCARDEIAQAVVPAVAAGFLEPHRAARQVDFIVRHQHLRRRASCRSPARSDRSAAAIHESHAAWRARAPRRRSVRARARPGACLEAEHAAVAPRQLIHEPEARVVTRARVFGARIAEADDELECVAGHVSSGTETTRRDDDRRAAEVHSQLAGRGGPQPARTCTYFLPPSFFAGAAAARPWRRQPWHRQPSRQRPHLRPEQQRLRQASRQRLRRSVPALPHAADGS